MNRPIVSIIVPIYNVEPYLTRCLKSLVNQTFGDIEIICVVAAARDNCLKICTSFAEKDSRLVIINQEPQGLSAARNKGISIARGTYIQFCDSDDYYDLRMCEVMCNAITSSGADLSMSETAVIRNGMPVQTGDPYYQVPFDGICNIDEHIFKKTNVFSWNKIFRKSIIDKYDIKFPFGLNCEDACFLFKYLSVSKTICYINKVLYFYVRRTDSLMSASSVSGAPRALDHVYILNDIAMFLHAWKMERAFGNIFAWIIVVYTNLAVLYGGEEISRDVFNIGVSLTKDIDYNRCMDIGYTKNEIARLYALKTNNFDLFLSTTSVLIKGTGADLIIPSLLSCFCFPWYIYKIFCMVYNKIISKPSIGLMLKAYIFFPYYALKSYLLLLSQTPYATGNSGRR
jgi:glycosyltransferase involved in cell wall biosynthesis